jgi:hypothetical protein
LEKQKEENVKLIRQRLGGRALTYDAIQAARTRQLRIPNLLGGESKLCTSVGTMLSEGDGRILEVNLETSIGQQKTVTCSFDTASMQCLCEGSHKSSGLATGRGGDDGRVAIILSDQAYPAHWVGGGDKACVRILRVEYAMLYELAEELIIKLRGRYVAAGSIIMIFSATNLAAAGTAAYCEDLVSSIRLLKRNIGEHVIFTPLPPFFLGGCGDEARVRAAVEVGV